MTLTADNKFSSNIKENFPQPIQMQLSKKPKMFYQHFILFLQ